ncbi:MAG: diaminopimelate epimerase [Acidobacteria bacterium]|nr:diaminopimelate epimerase [Acidobacteriota bacterium]
MTAYNNIKEAENLKQLSSIEDFARKACHRNTGIGGDGIAVLEKLENETADYACRIINPDGSEAGFSGNGTRCAVAYLYFKNFWQEKSLELQTKSGIKTYELVERNEETFWFLAELGKPKFDLPETPLSERRFGAAIKAQNAEGFNLLLPKEGIVIAFTFVNVGNPVAVIFLEDFNQINWRQFGSKIENITEIFPERINVVFVKVIDKENIEIRIWERGAGETSSSGTCSIAAAVAGAFTGKTERKVSVHAAGGTTEAIWREDDEMLITGRADLVFCGEWFENA